MHNSFNGHKKEQLPYWELLILWFSGFSRPGQRNLLPKRGAALPAVSDYQGKL